jgi:hypothetical protein
MIQTVVKAFAFSDGRQAFYWCVHPKGMSKEEAWASQKRYGPFQSDAEVKKSEIAILVGEQCEVIEGGKWDPAWDSPRRRMSRAGTNEQRQ